MSASVNKSVTTAREPNGGLIAPATASDSPGRGAYPCCTDVSSSSQVRRSICRYPDGSFEGSAVFSAEHWTPPGQGKGSYHELQQEERDILNNQRASRRASLVLRRFIRTHDLKRLLTFTTGDSEGWASRKESLDCVSDFLKVHGALLGDTAIATVAERGLHGQRRWHVHAAIRSGYRLPYSTIIATWSNFLNRRGYSSVTGTHRWHAGDEQGRGGLGFKSARVCAGYMAKYLVKSMEVVEAEHYVHRYRTAGGPVPKPEVSRHQTLQDAMPSNVRWVMPLDFADGETGELHVYGYLFDGGG